MNDDEIVKDAERRYAGLMPDYPRPIHGTTMMPLPCPFCGSPNICLSIGWSVEHIFIRCIDCGATGPVFPLDEKEKEKTIEAWNKRQR